MTSQPLIVLDTGVWISGVFFRRGIPAALLRAWRDRRFQVVFTPDTLRKLEHKLREKGNNFGADPSLAEEWISYIKAFARFVQAAVPVEGVCRDPDDDMFLVAALSSEASHIVYGDHDLQVLQEYQGVKVLSPREFAEAQGLAPPPQSIRKNLNQAS